MSSLPALENAFLRYTDTRGRLNCSMLDAATNLKRLSLSGNTDLVGEIPGCFLQVRSSLCLPGFGVQGQGRRVKLPGSLCGTQGYTPSLCRTMVALA
jgi:hypothetical protein